MPLETETDLNRGFSSKFAFNAPLAYAVKFLGVPRPLDSTAPNPYEWARGAKAIITVLNTWPQKYDACRFSDSEVKDILDDVILRGEQAIDAFQNLRYKKDGRFVLFDHLFQEYKQKHMIPLLKEGIDAIHVGIEKQFPGFEVAVRDYNKLYSFLRPQTPNKSTLVTIAKDTIDSGTRDVSLRGGEILIDKLPTAVRMAVQFGLARVTAVSTFSLQSVTESTFSNFGPPSYFVGLQGVLIIEARVAFTGSAEQSAAKFLASSVNAPGLVHGMSFTVHPKALSNWEESWGVPTKSNVSGIKRSYEQYFHPTLNGHSMQLIDNANDVISTDARLLLDIFFKEEAMKLVDTWLSTIDNSRVEDLQLAIENIDKFSALGLGASARKIISGGANMLPQSRADIKRVLAEMVAGEMLGAPMNPELAISKAGDKFEGAVAAANIEHPNQLAFSSEAESNLRELVVVLRGLIPSHN